MKAVGRIDRGDAAVSRCSPTRRRRSPGPGGAGRRPEERPADPRAGPGPGRRRPRGPHHGDPRQRQDAVALTVFRRLGGNALAISRDLDAVLADAAEVGPAGHPDRAGLRPGPAGADRHRQRPRRDPRRRPVQRAGPAVVPQERPGHAARGAVDPVEPGHQLPLPAAHRRHAEPDVAGRAGRGHRPDHRRLGGGRSRTSPGTWPKGSRATRPIDRASREISGAVIGSTLTTILVFVPLAFVRGRDRAVLPVAEPGADGGPAGLDGREPDAGAGAGGPLPGAAADARTAARSTTSLADGYERLLRVGLRFPRHGRGLALLAVLPGWWLFATSKTGFMPEMDEGAFVLDYRNAGRHLACGRPTRCSAAWRPCCPRHARRGRLHPPHRRANWASSPPSRTRGDILVSLKPAGQRRAMRGDLSTPSASGSMRPSPSCAARSSSRRLVARPDQRPQRRGHARRGQDLRARSWRSSASLAAEVGTIVKKAGAEDVNDPRGPGQSGHRRPPRQRADGPRRPDRHGRGERSSTRPSTARWPARCRSRTGITNIRVRYPDRRPLRPGPLAQLPISLAAPRRARPWRSAAAPTAWARRSSRWAKLASIEVAPQSQRAVARKPAAGDHRHGRVGQRRDLGSVDRELQHDAGRRSTFPPGYRWELAGDYRSQQESFASLLMVLIVASALVFLLLGFPVPQPDAAAVDLSHPADLAGQRHVRPLDHRHAA